MSIGKIKSMKRHSIYTPNAGILTDLDTEIDYNFTRSAFTGIVTKWNVKVHDIVTFTILGTNATEVILLRKHNDKLVYSII